MDGCLTGQMDGKMLGVSELVWILVFHNRSHHQMHGNKEVGQGYFHIQLGVWEDPLSLLRRTGPWESEDTSGGGWENPCGLVIRDSLTNLPIPPIFYLASNSSR